MENVSKATTPKAKTSPIGVVGLKTSSGKIEEEFIYDLQWPDAGRIYQEMSYNDAVVGGCLYLIETLIRQARWRTEPASKEAGDLEAAEFLESCMNDMSETWDAFICEALSMLPYGFSFHEIVYKTRRGPTERDKKFRSKYTDGRIGWQDLTVRSQATLSEWIADETTGDITHFRQDPSLVGSQAPMQDIPLEGNLLFRTKATRGNPEGWSILRRAYRSWYFKRYIEELEGIGIERNLAGIPVLAPPPDTPLFDPNNKEMRDMLAWAQELIDGLRQDRNHGIIIPNTDWELKLLGVDGAGRSIDTDTVIRRHENRIAMSMLADVVLMGGDRTGSFALAETKQSLLMSSLQAIINSIADTLNQDAVPTLFLLNNWQLEKYPKIVADDLQPVTIKDVALLLRCFKIDVTRDPTLFNYLLSLIQAPEMSEETFNEFMAAQGGGNTGGDAGGDTDPEADPEGDPLDEPHDPIDNTLSMTDSHNT